jgi:fucose 4-O-acetylase-like acetyltransferase
VVAAKYFLPVPATSAALQTPDDRDRIIDAARGISLMIVVAGHAVMGIVGWQYGVPKVGNLLAAYPWTQALTWVFQIVPLFFFAGGAANAISWDKHVKRGGSYAEWMWARAQRFLRPIWSYLLIMGFVAAIVTWLAPTRVAAPLMLLTTQLLWFLGSYILVTALTPIFKPATPLQGGIRVLSLLVACGLVDVLRFFQGFPNAVGVANFVLVWMVPGCLGALWAGGTIKRLSRPFLFSVLVFGITINALLIGWNAGGSHQQHVSTHRGACDSLRDLGYSRRALAKAADEIACARESMATGDVGEPCCDDLVSVAPTDAGASHFHFAFLRDGSPDPTRCQRLPGPGGLELCDRIHRFLVRFRNLRVGDHPFDVAAGACSTAGMGLAVEGDRAESLYRLLGFGHRSGGGRDQSLDALRDWFRRFPLQGRGLCELAAQFGRGNGSAPAVWSPDPLGGGAAIRTVMSSSSSGKQTDQDNEAR